MKPKTSIWPELLAQGGWSTRSSSGYWPEYFREIHGVNQVVFHNGFDWTLTFDGKQMEVGFLDDLLE